MFLKIFETLICVFSFKVLAFVEFGNGQEALEMIEQGRSQYQLLEERGRLPRYGECWRQALAHVQEGCRELSEETQSDMALHITNCFLAMSGHEVYNCELDKKPNLRGICINSMSDRAFNAYTEFYTHTQNICWFLRGQVWHEKITATTMQVGKKLEKSVEQQEKLAKEQQRSLQLQEKLLQYGLSLEKALNQSRDQATLAMDNMRDTIIRQQQLLSGVSDSVDALRSWLLGEISWIDALIFYIVAALLSTILTSTVRTSSARLPILLILSLNFCIERFICSNLSSNISHPTQAARDAMHLYTWWCRRITVFICATALVVLACLYRDLTTANNLLLTEIHKQNFIIKKALENSKVQNGTVHSMARESVSRGSTPEVKLSRGTTPTFGLSPRVHTSSYNLRSRLTPMRHSTKDDSEDLNNKV